jgi:hypothetical protein
MNSYEECESCFEKVDIFEMTVKGTPDGNCIYCPKCVEYHKFLEKELERLCYVYSIDTKQYK